ncbi:signal peptidase I [Companilactobacillus metriopterae]|uniref:signal peptidase I n=1 Tax=Companilactobacillus metriopterae TaxID=1909267 RepID=UPI00100B9ACA|nr:signal peptidase I [Companilactobacillus metriopterae]
MAKKNDNSKPVKEETTLAFWVQTAIYTIVMLAALFLLFTYVISNDKVSGPSMQPTFEDNERVITVRHSKLQRGDVVVLKAPDEPGSFYIKRIIGLPGDKIVSKNNKMYVNGKEFKEDFLDAGNKLTEPDTNLYYGKGYGYTYDFTLSQLAKSSSSWKERYSASERKDIEKTNQVPKGTYFVMGDHRTVSKDSRIIGFIDKKSIVGEVKLRYWPLNRLSLF